MEVNFLGTFAVKQAFAPVLAKNGGGAIAILNSEMSQATGPVFFADPKGLER
jgi:NAD(P)-dependent dehydrogenase (short-subunit alcohol dehydrogenase family)